MQKLVIETLLIVVVLGVLASFQPEPLTVFIYSLSVFVMSTVFVLVILVPVLALEAFVNLST